MKAYKMVTTLPSGKIIESRLMKYKRYADRMMADKAVQLMHLCVGREPEIQVVNVTFWVWIFI